MINKKEAEAKANAQIDATSDCLRRVMAALIDRKVHETCSAKLAHIKKSAAAKHEAKAKAFQEAVDILFDERRMYIYLEGSRQLPSIQGRVIDEW